VKYHHSYEDKEHIYIVLDYLEGGDLFYYLADNPKMTKKQIKNHIIQIVHTLQALHDRNIIYCDLKPENLCFDKNGLLYLIDFGCSKYKEESAYRFSPPYAAPEVLAHKIQDAISDWFSLGVLLYCMLTLSQPWENTCNEIHENNIEYPDFLDDESIDLLKKLLSKNRHRRLKNAKEILSHSFFE